MATSQNQNNYKRSLEPCLGQFKQKNNRRGSFKFCPKIMGSPFGKRIKYGSPQNQTLLKVPYRPFNRLKHRQIRQFDNKNNREKP